MTTNLATREAILAANKRRYREIEVPIVGAVRIQSLTERERNVCESWFFDKQGRRDADRSIESKARWIVECVVDEHGARMFTEADIPTLLALDAAATNHIFDEILQHVGYSETDRKALLGNSPGGPAAD